MKPLTWRLSGGQGLFSYQGFFNSIQIGPHSQSRLIWNSNRAVYLVQEKLFFNNVFFPITTCRTVISWHPKIGQAGCRQIGCPSDPGFQHAAAPDRDPPILAEIMDFPSLPQTSHPSGFNIDHLFKAQTAWSGEWMLSSRQMGVSINF